MGNQSGDTLVVCSNPELSLFELRRFQDLIQRQAGIHLTDAKRALVQNRLLGRLAERGIDSFLAYHDLVSREPGELQQCIDALTTNETFFFRHQQHWEYLRQTFLPDWLARRDDQTLQLWSAGCSSGEEAYTAAILLREHLPEDVDHQIEGTDINASVLERARSAEYGRYALQLVEERYRGRCFDQLDAHRWRLRPPYAEHVRFSRGNLLEAGPGRSYDLIFMRNVLIYFAPENRRRCLENAQRRLQPGGVLIVGASETLHDQSDLFRPIGPAIYRRAEGGCCHGHR